MDARQSRRGKRISLQQEKRAAADLGGRTMAASGATRMGGGADVRLMGKIRLECKITEKDTYLIKVDELKKVRKQAIKALEIPVFQFAFRHTNSRMTQFAIVSWEGPGIHPPTCLWTDKKSLSVSESSLSDALSKGRVQLAFLSTDDPSSNHCFEIMRWDDFVERHNSNA